MTSSKSLYKMKSILENTDIMTAICLAIQVEVNIKDRSI